MYRKNIFAKILGKARCCLSNYYISDHAKRRNIDEFAEDRISVVSLIIAFNLYRFLRVNDNKILEVVTKHLEVRTTYSERDATHSSVIAYHNILSALCCIKWHRFYILQYIWQKEKHHISLLYNKRPLQNLKELVVKHVNCNWLKIQLLVNRYLKMIWATIEIKKCVWTNKQMKSKKSKQVELKFNPVSRLYCKDRVKQSKSNVVRA